MLFNSFTFIYFFIIVYTCYYLTRNDLKKQNVVLLVASYVFYGFWSVPFLCLLVGTSIVDYQLSKQISSCVDDRKRKTYLILSLVMNLSFLGFFKYFNFFNANTISLAAHFGFQIDRFYLNIILPVGISFYTFQSISYIIDVYRRDLKPPSFLHYCLYIAFFPQLVAGPIERATHLIHQFVNKRYFIFENIMIGLTFIVMGYFKKLVIADISALIVNPVFTNPGNFSILDRALAVLAFTFQIYGDFAGYTDIARGVARLMGFDLMENFKSPYFAISPSDFWRRWHISLSSWLRDYLYIPLGGNKNGSIFTYRNLFITMLLGGLWHGAAWNFIAWGCFHGILLMLYRIMNVDEFLARFINNSLLKKMPFWIVMFILTNIGWWFFRMNGLDQATHFFSNTQNMNLANQVEASKLIWIALFIAADHFFYSYQKDIFRFLLPRPIAIGCLWALLLVLITVLGAREATEFIYFQF